MLQFSLCRFWLLITVALCCALVHCSVSDWSHIGARVALLLEDGKVNNNQPVMWRKLLPIELARITAMLQK